MYLLPDVGNGLGLFEAAQLSMSMSGFLTGRLYGGKVDGQKIQPLLWNGDAPFVTFSPKAEVVDVYATSKFLLSCPQVKLDLMNKMVTVYKTAKFPR